MNKNSGYDLSNSNKITYFSFDLSTNAMAMQCPDNSRKAISYALMDLCCKKAQIEKKIKCCGKYMWHRVFM